MKRNHDEYELLRVVHSIKSLVGRYLAEIMVTLRNKVLAQYAEFYRKLLESPSREVRDIAKIVDFDTC